MILLLISSRFPDAFDDYHFHATASPLMICQYFSLRRASPRRPFLPHACAPKCTSCHDKMIFSIISSRLPPPRAETRRRPLICRRPYRTRMPDAQLLFAGKQYFSRRYAHATPPRHASMPMRASLYYSMTCRQVSHNVDASPARMFTMITHEQIPCAIPRAGRKAGWAGRRLYSPKTAPTKAPMILSIETLRYEPPLTPR